MSTSLRVLAGVLVLLTPCLYTLAQPVSFDLTGYAKQLGVRLAVPGTGNSYLLSVSRARLQGALDVGAGLRTEIWLDSELLLSRYLGSEAYTQAQAFARHSWVTLDWTITSGKNYTLQQRLFRAFAQYQTRMATITVGRQRIAWGSGFAWNPTDLLNPFNPGAIELGERAGVDAVHVRIPLGTLSGVEIVAAYTDRDTPGSFAARASTNVRSYDLTVMAGRFRKDWVVGGDFAGYLQGAGVRGEWAYVHHSTDRNYLRAVLNADYTFPRGVYALFELYYNGRGAARKEAYNFSDLLRGNTFNLAQLYAAQSVAASITPLFGVGLYQLVNLTDGSLLMGPSLTYSLTQSIEVAVATYFFAGAGDTEFGRQHHTYFATIQGYF